MNTANLNRTRTKLSPAWPGFVPCATLYPSFTAGHWRVGLKVVSRLLLALLLTAVVLPTALIAEETRTAELVISEGERWWAGVVTDSHRMPFDAGTEYEFDFFGDTAGNQGQPLLVSNRGRYVWSEDPFWFRIAVGRLRVRSQFGSISIGKQGETLRDVFRHVNKAFFPPRGRTPDPSLFARPQFNTWIELTYDQNQQDILKYARAAVDNGFPPGVLMIDEGWAKSYGDWEFDRARFENPEAMVKQLRVLGFKVMLWVCPYITPAGPYYKDLWLNHTLRGDTIWILNAGNPSAPAIMEWWDGFSAVVDLTNPKGRDWFKRQLDHLVSKYGVEGFKFDGGDAIHYSAKSMLTPARSFKTDTTPNDHSEAFARLGLDYPLNEYRACWKMGGQPLAQRLRDKEHTWEDLRKLIPGMINQGLMGYAFTCPDLIGGGEYLSFLNLDRVDQELIVRAAQCHALMPMMQFSVAPWRVLSPDNLAICRQMARLHTEMGEEILKLARESAITGDPIVRSLEFEYPHRGYVEIDDQFLLGTSILVAPVLVKGATARRIIIPPGRWIGDDGTSVSGPTVIEVEAPLERLPWYRRAE